MQGNDENQLVYEAGLAFFGRVTAGVSHDLKNALSVISELGGLMEDALFAAEKGNAITNEQLAKVSEGVNRQVQRINAAVKRMHHFSHNVDDFRACASLAEIVEEVAHFCQRPALLKKVRLTVTYDDEANATIDKVFLWQHLVYEGFRTFLESATEGDEITIRAGMSGSVPSIEIASTGGLGGDAIERSMPVLSALTQRLGVVQEFEQSPQGIVGLRVGVAAASKPS